MENPFENKINLQTKQQPKYKKNVWLVEDENGEVEIFIAYPGDLINERMNLFHLKEGTLDRILVTAILLPFPWGESEQRELNNKAIRHPEVELWLWNNRDYRKLDHPQLITRDSKDQILENLVNSYDLTTRKIRLKAFGVLYQY